jgi:hypothetical protein
MKIVINRCYGGFSLSKEAYKMLDLEWDGYGFTYSDNDKRTDPKLVKCVEVLGAKANGEYSDLKVVEIPDNIDWYIDDYDGLESVKDGYRSWH